MNRSVRLLALAWALSLGLLACASAPDRGPTDAPETAAQQAGTQPVDVDAPGAATQGSTPSPADDPTQIVLAHLDGAPITLADAMAQFEGKHMGHGTIVRSDANVRELIGRVAEQRLFEREARDLGLFDDKDVLGAVDERRWELAVQRFWKAEVDDKSTVSDEEVEAFYDKTDMVLKASLIVAATEAEARDLRARVEAGEDFGVLAQQHSIHPSRTFGGLMSVVRRGELDPALDPLAFALETPGALTDVVATRDGFSFLRLEERILNTERPPRDVALPQIRGVLENRKKDERHEVVVGELLAKYGCSVDEALATPAAVLGEGRDDVVVAAALGETLTLAQLRERIDLDRLRAATAPRAAEVTLGLARQWAADLAARKEAEARGLRELPDVQKACEQYRHDLAMGLLYEGYVYKGIDPDDAALRAFYDANQATHFTQPPEVRLAYIVVQTADQAADALRRIDAGEDFGQVAQEVSIDARSRVHGGRIGWVRPTELTPEVEQRAFAMQVGETAGPIETPVGFFLLRLLDRKEPVLVPYELARAAARKRLTKDLRLKAYDDWAQRLRERAVLEVDADGVARAVRHLEAEAAAAEKAKLDAGPLAPGAERPKEHP